MYRQVFSINLLEHVLVLQSCLWEVTPTQAAPPLANLTHTRVLVCDPVPHVTEQGDHTVHEPQPPETKVLHCIDEIEVYINLCNQKIKDDLAEYN